MSTIFELDEQGWQDRISEARLSTFDANQALDATATEGIAEGLGKGIMRGGAKAADTLLTIGRTIDPLTYLSDTPEDKDLLDRAQDEMRTSALDFWTPSSQDVGVIGRTLGGFGEIVLPLAASAGNPSLLIGSAGIQGGKDLVDQGVDATTAAVGGTTEALATAVGFKMPFLGKSLATKIVSGAVGNVAVGAGATELQRELLAGRGYEELSQNYDPLDMQSRAIDLLTGAAFGGLDYFGSRISPSDRAAIAAANNAKHLQADIAPGVPANFAASAAHQRAAEVAAEQMDVGDPVNVPADVTQAEFNARADRPKAAIPDEFVAFDAARAADVMQASEIPRAPSLIEGDRTIEADFATRIEKDVDAAAVEYSKLEDSAGGKILNTDVARELSPDYLKDRTKSAAVHEPASWLIKKLYAKKLAEAPRAGEEPLVLFSAGGTGAGKTSGLNLLPDLVAAAQIVYDTNMNRFEGARQKIDQALEAGKNVEIVYTYREPIEALKNGALPRAARQEKKFGSGRTVPIEEHLGTHVGSRQTMDQIAAHYAGDDRVVITAIDNSRGKDGARVVELGEIPKLPEEAYNGLREKAGTTLQAELAAGRISEAVHRGFAGDRAQAAGTGQGRVNRQESQSPGDGGRVDDPVTDAVRASLAAEDLQLPTGEIDADGNPVTVSAREALAQADADVADAELMGKGILAAVTCFISRGV